MDKGNLGYFSPFAIHLEAKTRLNVQQQSIICSHLEGLKHHHIQSGDKDGPAAPFLSQEATQLLESYRYCVRFSLLQRNKFQLHLNRKGKEFKAMIAVDVEASSSITSPNTALHSPPPNNLRNGQEMEVDGKPPQPSLKRSSSTDGVSVSKRRPLDASFEKAAHAADKLPTPSCCACDAFMSLSRLHCCLSCVYMGCWKDKHIQSHLKAKKHCFAMDFVHCIVFCVECNDYIYDLDMDHILHSEKSRMDVIVARVKEPILIRTVFPDWNPRLAEIRQIQTGSVLKRCSGIRGLRNLGSTCFMNTILQTLIHNPLLKAHFLSDKHTRNDCPYNSQVCLACEMDDLFCKFYNGETSPIVPASFLHAMWISQKHLAGYSQQDAHEFFISALNEIHLNCSGVIDNHSPCKCIIHQVFGGILQSDVTCLKCGNVTTTSDPILDVSLDIRQSLKAAQAKKQAEDKSGPLDAFFKPNTIQTSQLKHSLVDCLESFTHPEKLGVNQYTCASCSHTFQEAAKQLSLKKLPPVLAVQLKRFEHTSTTSTKIDTPISIPAELDMTPYTTRSIKLFTKLRGQKESSSKKPPLRGISGLHTILDGIPTYKYTLFAVVNHEGKIDTGHYRSYAKCRDNWFLFDDHSVLLANQTQVLSSNPYMCFYIRDNVEYAPSSVVEVRTNILSPDTPDTSKHDLMPIDDLTS